MWFWFYNSLTISYVTHFFQVPVHYLCLHLSKLHLLPRFFFFFFTIYIFLFERGKETKRGKQSLFLKMLQQLRLSHSKCKNPELKYWTVKYCHVRCVLTWSWIRSRVTSWFEPADTLICDVGVPSSNLI